MKWAKRKHEADPNIPPHQRAAHFNEYDEVIITVGPYNKKIATAKNGGAVVKTLFEWVRFPNTEYPDPIDIPQKKGQRKYEIFCGGFLNFYEETLREYLPEVFKKYFPTADTVFKDNFLKYFKDKPGDYEVFFEWANNGDSVIIFLNPDPGNPDPPSPPAPPPPETST
jgi:hypothetical protein